MSVLKPFKALLWPNACLTCGMTTQDPILCEACHAASKRTAAPVVLSGGESIRPASAVWKFDRDEPIRFVLHRLKYGNCPWIGLYLGACVGESTPACPGGDWNVIVPVPLHPKRLLERGYNQSEWIARGVGTALRLPVVSDALARRRNTRSQTNFSREDRPTNVRDAFEIVETDGLRGSNVLLVDDTLTTGATLTEAARMLVDAGAATVQPVAVALATLRKDEEQPDAGSVIPSRHQTAFHEPSFLGYNL